MRKCVFFITVFIFYYSFITQGQGISDGKKDVLDPTTNPGLYIDELPLPKAKEKRSVYLEQDFYQGYIELNNGYKVDSVSIRCDLLNKLIEVKRSNKPDRIIDLFQLKSFSYQTPSKNNMIFITGHNKKNLPIDFYEILDQSDNYSLLKQHYVEVKRPNYNPALDVGSKDYEYIIKNKIILLTGPKVEYLKRKISSLSKSFDIEKQIIKTYIKRNSLDLNVDHDFTQIIEFIISKH